MSALRFVRLLLSVAFEGAVSAFFLILFPFRRKRERQRIRSIMCRKQVASCVVWLALAATSLLCQGCVTTGFPGASFHKQVDELQWSTTTVIGYSEWDDDLYDLWLDLESITDPELGELGSSFEMIGW